MTPEGKVKAAIDRLLKGYGVWYFAPVQYGLGAHGIHDRVCCIPVVITQAMVGKTIGRMLTIEAKKDKAKTATKLQQQRAKEVHEHGGISVLVNMERLHHLEAVLRLMTGRDYDESRGSAKPKGARRRRRRQ